MAIENAFPGWGSWLRLAFIGHGQLPTSSFPPVVSSSVTPPQRPQLPSSSFSFPAPHHSRRLCSHLLPPNCLQEDCFITQISFYHFTFKNFLWFPLSVELKLLSMCRRFLIASPQPMPLSSLGSSHTQFLLPEWIIYFHMPIPCSTFSMPESSSNIIYEAASNSHRLLLYVLMYFVFFLV